MCAMSKKQKNKNKTHTIFTQTKTQILVSMEIVNAGALKFAPKIVVIKHSNKHTYLSSVSIL